MLFGKKADPSPSGVRLGVLLSMLNATSIKGHLDGNALVARHEHYTTRIEVVPPVKRQSENGPIRAVVRIISELPNPVREFFKTPDKLDVMNKYAALGALTFDNGKAYIGSRLTIYELEDAWDSLHLPMLLFTTICGADAILGGIRRLLNAEGDAGGESVWTKKDMDQVHGILSRSCVCTTGDDGITAEFGLEKGAVSAVVGHHKTALFQLMADQPHPELGGGLFCLLQMPHQISDRERLRQVCIHLNKMEMSPHDLPPHFGAWCVGTLGNNPAYVSFLPNALYRVDGIAVNVSFWALNRAEYANAMLTSLGVHQ